VRKLSVAALAVVLVIVGCNGSTGANTQELQRQADLYAIDQIEATWHKAASMHDVDLMMSIWADSATFSLGTRQLTGKDQIRAFFATEAAPFKAENNWISETPAYKIRTTVNGDTGTLYFECHYVDVATKTVKLVVGSDQKVARIDGKWLITESVGATPEFAP
jgi:ketosteroid isomerase-like protein